MTLVSTERGLVGLVRKVADEDEGAARMLLRLGAYETLCTLADELQPDYEERVSAFIAKRSEEGRRALVKSFIERRLAGEDVGEVLTAAEYMTLVEVGKADKPYHGDDPDERDARGRFKRAGSVMNASADVLEAMGRSNNRYQQLHDVGSVVRSKEPAIGTALMAAGKLGPEAEKVLGPGIQRAAYRYRGTERRPRPGLTNAVNEHQEALGVRDQQLAQQGYGSDQRRLAARGDAVAAYFAGQLPKPQDAELSLASGRVPPSRGAIIDADGDVISEAVGMNGDHYVPFDLKNLARMEGGQYVRTRAAGGPTREDLYTGLMSGARQVQVVSHSGVFTLELDPTLRGSRRYSDKARSMVDRYQQILQTIHDEKVAAVPLTEAQRKTLRDRALRASGGDVGEARRKLPELEREEMQRLAFERDREAEDAEVAEAVQHRLAAEERKSGAPFGREQKARIAQQIQAEVREQMASETPRSLRLDGEGYARALEALQGEYPYFIRDVRHEQLREFGESMGQRQLVQTLPAKGPRDRGFVQAGENLASIAGRSTDRDYRADRTKSISTSATPAATETAGASAAPGAATPTTGTSPARTSSRGEGGVPVFIPPKLRRAKPLAELLESTGGEKIVDAVARPMRRLDEALLYNHDTDTEKLKRSQENGSELLNWAFRKNGAEGGKTVRWLLTEATDHERKLLIEALGEAGDAARRVQRFSDEDHSAVQDAADQLIELLNVTRKAEPATPEKMLAKLSADARPLGFEQIDALGYDTQNLEAWQAMASEDPVIRAAIDHGTLHTEIRNRTRLLADLEEYLKDPENTDPPSPELASIKDAQAERDRLKVDLPKMHLAWAYQDRYDAAVTLTDSLGQEGEQRPTPTRDSVDKRGRVRLSRPLRVSEVRKSAGLSRREHQQLLEQMVLSGVL